MSTTLNLSRVEWVKSSYSSNGGAQCIEWAPRAATTGAVPVRDSKDPHGPSLVFTSTAFTAFVAGVKSGEFGTV
ncbi:DUF397 domain-containing protein [Kitasatospora sp. NPDC006697]|uniref:DUF397 domain-containing protein n=1 Tax=Kitasatospora sp. NPDC006697 TaxID=3364020 RepID=UPI00368F126C